MRWVAAVVRLRFWRVYVLIDSWGDDLWFFATHVVTLDNHANSIAHAPGSRVAGAASARACCDLDVSGTPDEIDL